MHKLKFTKENELFVAEHINSFKHSVKRYFPTEEKRNDYKEALIDYCEIKDYNLEITGETND